MSPSPRDSLTARTIRAFWFFGLALLAVFAGLVIYALIQIGDRIYARQMMAEMDHVMSRIEAGTPIQEALPSSAFLKGYAGLESLPAELRPHLADRSDGIHELVDELGGGLWRRLNYHVAIRTPPGNGQRLFLIYDASRLEIDEDWRSAAQPWALVAGLVVIVTLGLWWGRRLAHRTVAPIVELARQVERSGPGELTAPDGPQSYPQEVEVLAEALRQAAHRVNQFVARERRFTRNASHELRTPITVIRGAVELLDDSVGPDNDRTRRLVGRITRSVERMEGIIDAFLWLAREADGRTETEWCRLEELLPALIEQHRHLARGKDVEVRLEPGDGLLVGAPEPVLSIAVGNLLANALTATSQGCVSIVLEENRLTISDTGPGIEPERLDAVTRPYVTGDSGGHGLGLAIVQEICERFGWRLELHSRHGEGTRAVLRFQTN